MKRMEEIIRGEKETITHDVFLTFAELAETYCCAK